MTKFEKHCVFRIIRRKRFYRKGMAGMAAPGSGAGAGGRT
jgi:hypothetical protein